MNFVFTWENNWYGTLNAVLTAFWCKLFLQNIPFKIFDWVLDTHLASIYNVAIYNVAIAMLQYSQ